jgi:hypothetical protein
MRRGVIDISAPTREPDFDSPSIPLSNVRQLRPRAERSSVWIAFAVFAGAIVALAFVLILGS